MHESFIKDDAAKFTANGLRGRIRCLGVRAEDVPGASGRYELSGCDDRVRRPSRDNNSFSLLNEDYLPSGVARHRTENWIASTFFRLMLMRRPE